MCSDWRVSIRKACVALQFDPSTYHYKSRRTDPAALKKRIKEICETRVRYGYRRVHFVLQREGWPVNVKKTYRIDKEMGLQLRNKTPKRRVKAKLRDDRAVAVGNNDVWVMDFVHDQLATGRKLRVLTVVDTFSRFVPTLDVRFSYRGTDVVETLDRGVILDFSRPGKPTDNPFIEAFNGKFRQECLNAHWFLSLADAAEKLETWCRYYNEERPHSAIRNKSPIMLVKPDGDTSPPT
jgi:putative transposase